MSIERRLARRWDVRWEGSLLNQGGEPFVTINVSSGGAAIVSPMRLSPGGSCAVSMKALHPLSQEACPVTIQCRIRDVRPDPAGFRLSLAFDDEQSMDEEDRRWLDTIFTLFEEGVTPVSIGQGISLEGRI